MSRLAAKGAVASTAIVVHVPVPAGLRSNVTCVVSAEVVVVSATVPRTAEPGLSSVTVGGWLSTTIVRGSSETVGPLPATSFASTVTETGPSGVEVESQVTDAGEPVDVPTTVPSTLKIIARRRRWRRPPSRVSVTVPPTCAPGAGAVTAAALGAVLSIDLRPREVTVVTFAGIAASTSSSRRSYGPSAIAVVSNEVDHGADGRSADRRPGAGAVRRVLERDRCDAGAAVGRRRVGERDVPTSSEPGSTGAPLGACVSIVTLACRTGSELPTLSTEP